MDTEKIFKILSIDGGGIRGVFPAHILSCISHKLGINIKEQFDLIAGTSTGSIIAAAIACNIDPKNIVSLYKDKGTVIFTPKGSWLPKKYKPAFHSLYNSNTLSAVLKDVFGETKLGEIDIPLIIPATDVGLGGVHVLKSYYGDFDRDKNVPLYRAILASCAAPTFFDPIKVNKYLIADGGLWANNPSLSAVIDAKKRLGIAFENIKVLSLGTGHTRKNYGVSTDKSWGLLNGWNGKEFIGFILSLQSQSVNNYLQLMLTENQLLRLDFESDRPLPLDNCSSIDDLLSRADKEFTYHSSKIKQFLSSSGGQ